MGTLKWGLKGTEEVPEHELSNPEVGGSILQATGEAPKHWRAQPA